MKRTLRGAVLVATTLTTTLAVVVTLAPPVQAAPRPPKQLSGNWLTKQLTDGLVHNDAFDVDDYGLSADTALALAALGGHRARVGEISDALAAHVNSYITGEDFGDTGSTYAGPVAKTLVLAQTAQADPTAFGGVDLVSTLETTVSTTAPTKGRIADTSPVFLSDYANVFGQALAVQGLAAAGSDQAKPALRFLLQQQCDAGYFRLQFTEDKTAADQTCDGGRRKSTSAPDTDATALAVLSLSSLDPRTKPVRHAIRDAVSWLVRRQKANGSFGGGPSTEASNANSTGLAAWALGATGSCRAAAPAARWVRDLQVTTVRSGSPLATERGAIAYDRAAYAAGVTDGIVVGTQDQWRRATAQAAPALGYLSVARCRLR